MNCIIVDDEPLARKGMEQLVASNAKLTLLKTFQSAIGVSDYLKNNQVDIIFLDIEMPGVNGLEFAQSIPKNTLIIFATAYSEYASDSYEVDAIDYLVKPIDSQRFSKSIEKAENYLKLLNNFKASIESASDDYITIRVDRMNRKVLYNKIIYIEALKDYVIIYTKDDKYITWMNLKTIHSRLPQATFVRVSKSYVVNLSEIVSYDNNTVIVDGNEIAIGKAFKDEVLAKIK